MKQIFVIYFFSLFGVMLSSCVEKNKLSNPIEHFKSVQFRKIDVSQYIDLEKYEVYKPASIAKIKGNYLLYNQTQENIISYIDIFNDTVINGVKRGEAPNEIISPSSFHKLGDDYLIYDIARKIIFKINIGNDLIQLSEFNRLKMQERLFVINAAPNGVIASGIFDNSWITFYDEESLPVSSLNFPDFKETKDLSNVEKSSLYISSTIAISPDFTKIVCSTPNAGVISFSNIEKNELLEYKRLQYGSPLVKAPRAAGSSSIVFDKNNTVSFCGLSCDDDYVIALYSGRTFNSHGMSSHHCEHVLVYNWDGEPMAYFLLEIPLYSMGYDPENKKIYGIGYDPEGVIVEYDLKNFL